MKKSLMTYVRRSRLLSVLIVFIVTGSFSALHAFTVSYDISGIFSPEGGGLLEDGNGNQVEVWFPAMKYTAKLRFDLPPTVPGGHTSASFYTIDSRLSVKGYDVNAPGSESLFSFDFLGSAYVRIAIGNVYEEDHGVAVVFDYTDGPFGLNVFADFIWVYARDGAITPADTSPAALLKLNEAHAQEFVIYKSYPDYSSWSFILHSNTNIAVPTLSARVPDSGATLGLFGLAVGMLVCLPRAMRSRLKSIVP